MAGQEGRSQISEHEDYIDHLPLKRAYWPIREDAPGVWFDDLGEIRGRYNPGEPGRDSITINHRNLLDPDEGLSTALHQYQHAIQQRKSFPKRGSKDELGWQAQVPDLAAYLADNKPWPQSKGGEELAAKISQYMADKYPDFKGTSFQDIKPYILSRQLMGRLAPDKVAKDFLQQNAYHGYYKKLAEKQKPATSKSA